jgi:hypothetical protein
MELVVKAKKPFVKPIEILVYYIKSKQLRKILKLPAVLPGRTGNAFARHFQMGLGMLSRMPCRER